MSLVASHSPLDLVKLSAEHLRQRGVVGPRLDAELLVAHALGRRRLDLYLEFERPLSAEEVDSVRELVRRRASGEPVAYILGEKEFYGRSFGVTPHVLIPRPDSETLIECVLGWVDNSGGRKRDMTVLDLGTGSGCLGVTLACELANAMVVATDLSTRALEVAKANAVRHAVDARMSFADGSWWTFEMRSDRYDIVISNPPYIRTDEMGTLMRDVKDFEPLDALAGGDDGLDNYRAICTGLAARDVEFVALEVDSRRADEVVALLSESAPGVSVDVVADLTGRARVVTARCRP